MGRRKLRFSKLYSFSCFKSSFEDDHAQIGSKGYSRVVYCNDPDSPDALELDYKGNYVSTTKYSPANFIPKSLFEQFRRVANIYFLVVASVSFSPLAPYKAVSVLAPLILVIGVTMVKEAVEDWGRRKQDVEANNRKVKVLGKNSTFTQTRWKHLRVGDIVEVDKDEYFPADLLLLSSSYDDGVCYVETMNLDGETNLKLKHALEVTAPLHDEGSVKEFKAVIKCEDPNENLYSFVGTLHYNRSQYPLSPQQILLRDSKLKNTDYVYGVVIFTGHDTKVMKNAVDPPSKRSKIEKKMDKIIYILFSTLITISFIGSLFFGIETRRDYEDGKYTRWYLGPDRTNALYDPERAPLAAFFHFLTGLMLYGYLIPISLYVSIEVVKVLQSIFINQDQEMYHVEADRPARARTSNLNEELGQVDTVLSDKTGTLTCNSMEFVKCSIAGNPYGRGMTEVEWALLQRKSGKPVEVGDRPNDSGDSGKSVKGFNFRDERIMSGQWIHEQDSDYIQMFFQVLALCNTAVPEENKESHEISYEAESPDEAAFVVAAKEMGFELYERTQTTTSLHELDPVSGRRVDRKYKILHVLEFSSSRKRMSVIVRSMDNQLLLLSKGADSVMFDRLSKHGRVFESETKEHIKRYAEAGLRTLVIAFRKLDETEFGNWEAEFTKAKTAETADRDVLVDELADKIEKDLVLLGATAVEDKLQKGVPECINKLSQAGINIWVITGDKMETAINIGYACSLLRQGMKQIIITLDLPEIEALEKQGDKDVASKASLESVTKQINDGRSLLNSAKGSSLEFSLVIDGKSLGYALGKNLEKSFLELALDCASVICCRSTPKHKALVSIMLTPSSVVIDNLLCNVKKSDKSIGDMQVTRLVKTGTGKITLAIGDGANDVGMLQEADIGVGISGAEGMQAVMSSDYSIAQFRFLERLLLVHGHWCYRRIAMMICYFFYKNIAFGFTLFWYEAYASFSGQPAYNDWYMSFYNVFFTSWPVIALGVFDQDVSARLCLKYPVLYQEGVQNVLFSWSRILGWMCNGVLTSIIIFFFTTNSLINQALREDGQVTDYAILGATMYTCVVWTVNCQMALSINYFTWIQHFFIWGSIAFWYIFLLMYGYISPTVSTTAYMVLVEACIPSPLYWLVTLLVVVSALLPCFAYRAFQSRFRPMYHDIIQIRRAEGSEMESSSGSGELPTDVKLRVHNLKEGLRQRNS
ncbi:Probable phospholipid-transporting ATPase 8 [Linum perenne]